MQKYLYISSKRKIMLNCYESSNTGINHYTCMFSIYQVNVTESQLTGKVKKWKYTAVKNPQTWYSS